MIQRLRYFFTDTLWTYQVDNQPTYKQLSITWVKIFTIAFQKFQSDKNGLKSSALTFLSILSWVPALVILVGISHGFGFDIRREMYTLVQGQDLVAGKLFEFAEKLLQRTRGDLITITGLLVLFFTVGRLLHNIEGIFNSIWNIKKHRSLQRKFSDYTAMLLISPILVFFSSSVNIFISAELRHLVMNIGLAPYAYSFMEQLIKLVPYTLLWTLLSLLYIIMPNTKVNVRSAVLAGVLSGTLFQLTQWFYITFQIGVSNYNAIYGSLAALPLFLIWLHVSWNIALFGAELAYAHQHIKKYKKLIKSDSYSIQDQKYMAFVVLKQLCLAFDKGTAISLSHLINQTALPESTVLSTVDLLKSCNLIVELNTEENTYQPTMPLERITTRLLLERWEKVNASKNITDQDPVVLKLLTLPSSKSLDKPIIDWHSSDDTTPTSGQ